MQEVAKTKTNLKKCKCMSCPSYTYECKIKNTPQNIAKLMTDFEKVTHYEKMFCAFEKRSTMAKGIIGLVSNIFIILISGKLFGLFSKSAEISRWGYGYFSMNLNAIINPLSLGDYKWSRILQPRPQLFGQYDGFNYMGIGVLLGVLMVSIVLCLRKDFQIKSFILRNRYVIFCVF